MGLKASPITLKQAKEFIERFHRHHKPPVGHKFTIGVSLDGNLVGVATCGRPVARALDDGETIEVNRLCTDGTKNACSFLYRRAWRIAKEMGYKKLLTYTLPDEGGASLRASGFKLVAKTKGREWDTPSRRRKEANFPTTDKWRWELFQ